VLICPVLFRERCEGGDRGFRVGDWIHPHGLVLADDYREVRHQEICGLPFDVDPQRVGSLVGEFLCEAAFLKRFCEPVADLDEVHAHPLALGCRHPTCVKRLAIEEVEERLDVVGRFAPPKSWVWRDRYQQFFPE
jgi:hypothetical protein